MKACRRRGPDPWIRSLRYLAMAGWGALLCAFIVLSEARPQVETFFDRVYGIQLQQQWNMDLARYILWLMVAGLTLSLGGLVINSFRLRRRTDEWRFSLIFLGIICLTGILLYRINFP